MGKLRDALQRVTAPLDEMRQERLSAFCAELDVTPIAETEPRRYARVAGEVTDVREVSVGGAPTFEARISDGRSQMTAVFLGRPDVPGIDRGRRLMLAGVVALVDGQRRIVNPEYRLLPAA